MYDKDLKSMIETWGEGFELVADDRNTCFPWELPPTTKEDEERFRAFAKEFSRKYFGERADNLANVQYS